jgi:hypothetical protein
MSDKNQHYFFQHKAAPRSSPSPIHNINNKTHCIYLYTIQVGPKVFFSKKQKKSGVRILYPTSGFLFSLTPIQTSLSTKSQLCLQTKMVLSPNCKVNATNFFALSFSSFFATQSIPHNLMIILYNSITMRPSNQR